MTGSKAIEKKRSNKLWIVALMIVGVIVAVAGWQRLSSRSEATAHADAMPAAPAASTGDLVVIDDKNEKEVSTVAAKQQAVAIEHKATGRIGFNEDRLTPVFTPFTGRVVELLANKGDNVKAGQTLAVIESPDFVAAQNDLVSARSDVAKAKIGLDAAQVEADRAKRLHDEEALSTKDLQQATADLARAQDENRRAQAALTAVENRFALFGKNPQEIAAIGEHADSRVTLRAPIAGTIVDRKIGPGQWIRTDATDPLFLISDLSTLWVIADVYESDVAAIHLNSSVEVTVPAYPGRVFPAKVTFVSPTVDPATRTLRVRGVVSNPGGMLKPDMFASIKIGSATSQPAVTIPNSAVVVDGNDTLAFVQQAPGRFRRQKIELGEQTGDAVVVKSGLNAGDVVASRGALLLNEMGKAK